MSVMFLLAGAVCCADAALKPFPVLRPVPAYLDDEHRMFQSAPSVAVTPGGRLWCAWHTGGENEGEDNCTVIVSSGDGGRTWTEVAPSKIKNTSGRFFMGRLASGALLLVKNGPIDQQVGRNRIMAYVSDDDGDTWTGGLVLDERKEVSYPDVAQGRDGAIHIVHDRERRGAQEIIHHVVTEADVRAGRLVTAGSRLKDVVNKSLGKGM